MGREGVEWMYGLPVVKGYGDKTYLVTPELLRSYNPRITVGDVDISESVRDYRIDYKIEFSYKLLHFQRSVQTFFKAIMVSTKHKQPRPRNHHPNRRRKGKRR